MQKIATKNKSSLTPKTQSIINIKRLKFFKIIKPIYMYHKLIRLCPYSKEKDTLLKIVNSNTLNEWRSITHYKKSNFVIFVSLRIKLPNFNIKIYKSITYSK